MSQPSPNCIPADDTCVVAQVGTLTEPACLVPGDGILSDATANQAYNDALYVIFSQSIDIGFGNLTVSRVTVNSVTGLPAGMDYYANSLNSADATGAKGVTSITPAPGSSRGPAGCITIFGTPPAGLGVDSIRVAVDASGQVGSLSEDTVLTFAFRYNDVVGQAEPGLAASHSVGPNPLGTSLFQQVKATHSEQLVQALVDATGRTLISWEWTLTPGLNTRYQDLPSLPTGLYQLLTVSSSGRWYRTLVR